MNLRRSLIVVDHGSRRPEAHQHLEKLVRQIRARVAELDVRAAHMELAEPSLGHAIESAIAQGAHEIIVHPLFLGPGRHLARDLPALLRQAAARHPRVEIRQSRALGELPGLADLIVRSL